MTSWIRSALNNENVTQAQTEAARRLLNSALGLSFEIKSDENLNFIEEALELAVVDLLDSTEQLDELRQLSADAFQLLRTIDRPEQPIEAAKVCLRLGCLGVIGERGTDAARLLKERPWPKLPLDSSSWGDRTLAGILDIWLRVIRKDGWADLEEVQQRVVELREQQSSFEAVYLENLGASARTAAWELVALYHLAKAAEILAVYTTQGQVEGHYDVRQQLEAQFDRALMACSRAELIELDTLTRLVARAGQQLVDNCIWTVTRAVNSRVTEFVKNLVSSERKQAVFEMLPPQRRTLREQGLLGSGKRAVVVNLPTSSGKTLIAEFRILQALNQFDKEKGWVAYLAPTRALVNQITARLRRDFAPLGINVERVSPALEVDGREAELLTEKTDETIFRVLVTTPEKLDLLLRGGWEEKIERPLTLVVVDEAHNLAQPERGIKLELLLATINRECRYAQFLLLTPFIPNAKEIACWLAPDSCDDIEMGLDWKPNDRAIVLSHPVKGVARGQFSISLETLHTSKHTLTVPEKLALGTARHLDMTCSTVKNNASKLASVTANLLKIRGPVIILAQKVDHTWSMARNFKIDDQGRLGKNEDVQLVKRYLAQEFGDDFELCGLLDYGVGVHHAGLSDEAKALMEWLFEKEHIDVLVSTTTIAQGVNFPVSGVVFAAHQYPGSKYTGAKDMPPEDFWNIAGRAARADQGSVGIVALAATNDASAKKLREFVNRQVGELNSTLIAMVQEVMKTGGQFELHTLFNRPAWSAFLQYLAHTYRQIGDPDKYANEIEQVLRGTLGFQRLRRSHADWASRLLIGVQAYGERLAGKSLKLVDTTGFSWETVSITLNKLAEQRIDEDVWEPQLFNAGNRNLKILMGILLNVPELRANLEAATGGRGPDGDRLARMIQDWVNGASLPQMADDYFATNANGDIVGSTKALTDCCRNVFGKLTQTAAWGLAALQTMTFKEEFDRLSEADQQSLRNLPARVFYGVNTDEAIALRLLGVPRGAAAPLAKVLGDKVNTQPLPKLRNDLAREDVNIWSKALGRSGSDYYKVWRILEGLS